MCGRFTLRTPMNVLIEQFQLDLAAAQQLALFEPRYNIAPTQDVVVIRVAPENHRREAALLRWGLIPSWTKELKSGPPLINARAESLAEKPTFRTAVRQRRCLIPADGFYEWQQPEGGSSRAKKQPYHIHQRDNRPFAFAGLWEVWSAQSAAPNDALRIESCTIVTTAANRTLSSLHDRMPVILSPNDYNLWLDPAVKDVDAISHMLAPHDDDELVAEPVSTHVNRVANDDPRCLEAERSLF